MYTIPAQRTTEARRAMTDRSVVIAGPIGAVPESRVPGQRGGHSVGRMHQMIGRAGRPIVLIGKTEIYRPDGWAARPGRALSNSGRNLARPATSGKAGRPGGWKTPHRL